MSHISPDTLVPCGQHKGTRMEDALENPRCVEWLDGFADFSPFSRNPTTPALRACYYYMLAHPPTWRRHGCLSPSSKPTMYFVFDTETTGTFPVRKEPKTAADGRVYMNDVYGSGTGLPKNKAYTPDLELLQIAWSVVDPATYSPVTSYSTFVQPLTRPSTIYDVDMYAEAVKQGVSLQDAMTTLVKTLAHWDATHNLVMVAHNATFDRKVVAMSLARAGFNPDASWLAHAFHCTMASVLDLGRKEYYTWAHAHFPHHYLTRASLQRVLTHRGVPYDASDKTKDLKKRVAALHPSELTLCGSAPFELDGIKWPSNLQYLFVLLTGRDVIQTHRADDDVEMLVACLPHLVRRGWFVLPGSPTPPVPAPAPAPAFPNAKRVQLPSKTTKTSGRPKAKPSPASKRTSVVTPVRRYFLRSHGPAPVLCL
jgi:DNA polymerase III epsilon subunit-like protein